MKRTLLGVLLCATALGLSAQDNSKEIVKKGWNFAELWGAPQRQRKHAGQAWKRGADR